MLDRNSSDAKLREYIYETYSSQYFQFMGIKDMCSFDIRFVEKADWELHNGSCIECPKEGRSGYTLFIERNTLLNHKLNGLPVLFHEFTHIYDREIILKSFDATTSNRNLDLYTEYHATFVQMQIASGFKTTNENKTIFYDSLIADADTYTQLFDYLEAMARSDYQEIKSWIKTYAVAKLQKMFTYFMYSTARSQFTKTYCRTPQPQFADSDGFVLVFGNNAEMIIELLATTPVTHSMLQEIERWQHHRENNRWHTVCRNKLKTLYLIYDIIHHNSFQLQKL